MTGDQIIEFTKIIVPAVLSLMAFLTGLLAWLSSRDNSRKLVSVDAKADIASVKAGTAADKAQVAATAAGVAADKVETLGAQVISTKEHINSRMTELIASITSEQRLKGLQEGITQGIAIEVKRRAGEDAATAAGHAAGTAEQKGKQQS